MTFNRKWGKPDFVPTLDCKNISHLIKLSPLTLLSLLYVRFIIVLLLFGITQLTSSDSQYICWKWDVISTGKLFYGEPFKFIVSWNTTQNYVSFKWAEHWLSKWTLRWHAMSFYYSLFPMVHAPANRISAGLNSSVQFHWTVTLSGGSIYGPIINLELTQLWYAISYAIGNSTDAVI